MYNMDDKIQLKKNDSEKVRFQTHGYITIDSS